MTKYTFVSTLAVTVALGAAAQANTARDVINGYADLALAKYSDSLATARTLDAALKELVANPSEATHQAAKEAWLASRVPYQQTEAYRFGNAVVDDWEGKVNAWPLDEGLIDYVDTSFYGEESEENGAFLANVVATPAVMIGGQSIDASAITPALLQDLHEVDGVEANVATGYHAIEFLLWGQDLNGNEPGAGARAYTDFDAANCTNGSCDRRGEYLIAASELMLADLEEIVAAWGADGAARADLDGASDAEGISAILTGLGSLSYGELAGERMKLGLILHDPEEEHDCFADNTHNSHYYDAKGMQNVYLGTYIASDGAVTTVPSLSALTAAVNSDLDAEMTAKFEATMVAMQVMKDRADSGVEAYDQMIGFGNDEGNAVVQAAIDGLVDQTRTIEKLVAALGASEITVEGSDSLDNPSAVFE
ncbi:MAG: peptidase [Marinovum sp.]|nr:peptidase [Marinovum sp.]